MTCTEAGGYVVPRWPARRVGDVRWSVGSLKSVIGSVIFDCDGVLVDTEPISNRVLAGLLTQAGLPTTFEDCMRDYRGRAMASVLVLAEQRLGGPLPAGLSDRYY